jgi:hypothetical protein
MSQGNSLFSYLKQINVIFFLLQNQRTRKHNRSCLGEEAVPWEGEEVGKVCGRLIQCKHGIHMYLNKKMIPVETIPEKGGGGDKGEWWSV